MSSLVVPTNIAEPTLYPVISAQYILAKYHSRRALRTVVDTLLTSIPAAV